MRILDDAREGMNPDIRPQDDLYGHVNGTWLDTVEIPADRASWSPWAMLAEQAEEQVKAIIEDCAKGLVEGDDAAKIGDLYASFVDEDRIEALGHRPILPVLAAIDGLRDKRDLAAFYGEFERIGGSGLFGAYVATDPRDSEKYVVSIVQGGLGLPDESYYREDKFAEIREKYLAYLERILTLAERPDPKATAERVLALETRLAKGHWERAETRDVIKTYNPHTLDELRAMTPSFDWDAYVRNLGGDEATLADNVVRQPSYLEHLEQVLADTDLADFQAQLAVKAIRSAAPYLSSPFVEANFDFYGRTLSGTPELRARWKRAVAFVEGGIGEAVGREYVARHFPPAAKAAMDELVGNLLAAYRQSIAKLDWLGEETKQKAYGKLETFRPKIGYPDKFRDYSALQVTADDLLGNVAAVSAFDTDRELKKIGNPVDRDEWLMLPQTVNAYYYPGNNEICFPAAILQKPFFDVEAEPAENYGGIGAVIGHEIGHGFDDQGAQYDAKGNLDDWWTPEDKSAFQEKAQTLITQYDGFTPRDLPDEHVNGALTVGENIGDLGGLTIGIKAYRIAVGDAAMERDDQGLTGIERLFLSWSYCWRVKNRDEAARTLLATDPHSPPEFRANIVRNLDEFHDTFGTSPGDGLWLDPAERVRIW